MQYLILLQLLVKWNIKHNPSRQNRARILNI